MKNIYKRINSCRICGNKNLLSIINLGPQYIQGSFIKKNFPKPYLKKIPLELMLCQKCSLVQLKHTTNKNVLYKNYWYESGVNETMRNHLMTIAKEIIKKRSKKNKLIKKTFNALDIGCNDGTLLNFYPNFVKKYGIDPSQIINKVNKRRINTYRDFFPPKNKKFKNLKIKFDFITSIAMFYDLDDPNFFVKNIKFYLKDDGIWVFELSYLLDMLKLNSFDTICHEHLEYYSLHSLNYLMKKHDLKIFQIKKNKSNGGSIRCFVTHQKNKNYDKIHFKKKIKDFLEHEQKIKVKSVKPYRKFMSNINDIRTKTKKLLNSIIESNKKIHIYGASTKGNTILQWYKIDKQLIKYAADRNRAKWNSYTIGSKIKLISEKKSKSMKPDYYLVLPWHFKSEFLKREEKFLKNGGKMIFPLPRLKIY